MSSGQRLDRRRFAATVAVSGVGLSLAAAELVPRHALMRDRRPARSRVAILTADRYSDALEQLLYDGLKLFNLGVKGKNVLLKPNLVEYSADAAINTHPALVGAAATAFLRLGARSVTVAEGPGHQRDTFLLLVESGLGDQLRRRGVRFVDLNRDDVREVQSPTRIHRPGSPLVAEDGTLLRPDRVDAEGQDPPLGRRHAQHEKHVRRHPRVLLWLAQERPPLEGDSRKHPRHLCNRANPLRHSGWDRRHGGQWASSWEEQTAEHRRSRG